MADLEQVRAAGRAEMQRLLTERRATTGRAFTPEQVAQVRALTKDRKVA